MAKLTIQKYVNNNRQSKAYGKTYGRVKHIDTLDTLGIAQHVQKHGSIYTEDVLVGVGQLFSKCILELLQEGYKVKLNGVGTLYLTVKTIGEQDPDDFGAKNIKDVMVRFLPEMSPTWEWNPKERRNKARFRILGADEETDSGTSGDGGGDEPGEDRP